MTRGRVLVTGAGGFVGGVLALGFADLGWEVIGLDRAFDREWAHDGIRRVTADLAEGVPREVPRVDLVVHAAWVTTDPATLGITSAAYFTLNLDLLLSAQEYAARTRPAAFVFLSSSGVFAPTDATRGLTDDLRPTGSSAYAVAKRAGEGWAPAAIGPDTAVHVVRLGYLFGPGEAARPSRRRVSLVAHWVAAAREGRPLEVRSDDPVRDWTYTSDLAPALERVAAGPPANRPVHLGSPHVITDRAFAILLAAEVDGGEVIAVPPQGPVKPPMVPSDISSLGDFHWTDPQTGLRALLAPETPV